MAFQAGEGFVDFTARDSQMRRVLSGMKARLAGIGQAMKRASKIARNMLMVSAGAMLGFVKLFAVQEKAEKMLDAALSATGQNVEKYGKQLRDAAAAIQKLSVYGDEFLLQLMTQGLNLGVTADKMEQATKQAIGLATALQMDLATAMRYTVLAMQGEMTMLRRYIPELRNTTIVTEQLAIVMRVANAGWLQAQAETQTLSGRLDVLKNRVGDVAERLGSLLIPTLDRWIEKLDTLSAYMESLSEKDLEKLKEKAASVGRILIAIWIAPMLVTGIKGFIKLLGAVRKAMIFVGVTAGVTASILTGVFAVAALAAVAVVIALKKSLIEMELQLVKLQGVLAQHEKAMDAVAKARETKDSAEGWIAQANALEQLIEANKRLLKITKKMMQLDEYSSKKAQERLLNRIDKLKEIIDTDKEMLDWWRKRLEKSAQLDAEEAAAGRKTAEAKVFAEKLKWYLAAEKQKAIIRAEKERDELLALAKLEKDKLVIKERFSKLLADIEARYAEKKTDKEKEIKKEKEKPDIDAQIKQPVFVGLQEMYKRLAESSGKAKVPQQQLNVAIKSLTIQQKQLQTQKRVATASEDMKRSIDNLNIGLA